MINKNPTSSLDAIDNIFDVSSNLDALAEMFLLMNDADPMVIGKTFGFLHDLLHEYNETLDEAAKILCDCKITDPKKE